MGATTNRDDIYKSNKVYESLSLLTCRYEEPSRTRQKGTNWTLYNMVSYMKRSEIKETDLVIGQMKTHGLHSFMTLWSPAAG